MNLSFHFSCINSQEWECMISACITLLKTVGIPLVAQWKPIRLVSMRMWVRSLAPSVGQGSSVAMSYSVGRRCGWDPAWLWLWLWLEATTPVGCPSLGTSIYCRCGPKKKKKRKKKERKSFRSLKAKREVLGWPYSLLSLWDFYSPVTAASHAASPG